jgi:transcriptional regulator with PAS, ATPase and Fis domain
MQKHCWHENIAVAITVTNSEGTIIEMNQKAADTFSKSGGKTLIGKNILDCHPPKAQEKIKQLSQNKQTNVYSVEKKGVKKLIYQTPYFEHGEYAGLVEFSFEIPEQLPHFIRE